jgi:hypothetical protein
MLRAIPPMLVVKDLMPTRPSLELYNVDGLHAGAVAGGRARVNALNGHTFRKQVKLAQDELKRATLKSATFSRTGFFVLYTL